ncbi:hypothetical protein BJ912DRAFT_180587 [Pholiota molesta]|nr:hypothetical protein BJ912DRAFT_180587 [Pholiota molesta]
MGCPRYQSQVPGEKISRILTHSSSPTALPSSISSLPRICSSTRGAKVWPFKVSTVILEFINSGFPWLIADGSHIHIQVAPPGSSAPPELIGSHSISATLDSPPSNGVYCIAMPSALLFSPANASILVLGIMLWPSLWKARKRHHQLPCSNRLLANLQQPG